MGKGGNYRNHRWVITRVQLLRAQAAALSDPFRFLGKKEVGLGPRPAYTCDAHVSAVLLVTVYPYES